MTHRSSCNGALDLKRSNIKKAISDTSEGSRLTPARISKNDDLTFSLITTQVQNVEFKIVAVLAQPRFQWLDRARFLGKLLVDGICLLRRLQCCLALIQGTLHAAEIGEARSEVGQERVGTVLGKLLVDVDGLLGRLQRRLTLTEGVVSDAEVVETHREVGQEHVGAVLRKLLTDLDGLLGRLQGCVVLTEVALMNAEVVET